MFLKNKNIIFKIKRSKVTDYAALSFLKSNFFSTTVFIVIYGNKFIIHLVITLIWIQHGHVAARKFFLPWNFKKLKGIIGK